MGDSDMKSPTGLFHPEIVISGVSGRFPCSDSLQEFRDNLFNGVDMVTADSTRWPIGIWNLPPCSGKVKSFDKFDSDFFGYKTWKEVDFLDPQDRKLLEVTYEAIVDAGIDPLSLKDTKTGLFQGSCFPEYHKDFKDPLSTTTYIPNQVTTIARHFDLKGPYVHIDTACGSAACALNEAFKSLRLGLCETAIVTGANSVFQPIFSYEMRDLKMISEDGKSKCMDASANGYARAEAVAVMVLQKRPDAKRVYATIMNIKTNADGWKPEGVTFPGIDGQAKLLEETYADIGLDPNTFSYVEAHTTGTTAGDPVELNAIHRVLCSNRSTPLLVGCIKSNIGHSEGASGLCALIKSLFVLQEKKIPPNLHLKEYNMQINGLANGSFCPVNTITDFVGDKIPVNCFGFGGANVHLVVQSYDREVTTSSKDITSPIPRLVAVCGRTDASVAHIVTQLKDRPLMRTREFLFLLNEFTTSDINRFPFRSHLIINSDGSIDSCPIVRSPLKKVTLHFPSSYTPFHQSLLNIPIVAESLQRLTPSLQDIGVDLISCLHRSDPSSLTRKEEIAVTLATSIAMVHLLHKVGLVFDAFSADSFGHLMCGYLNGSLTQHQVMLGAFCAAAFESSPETLATSLNQLNLKPCPTSSKWVHHFKESDNIMTGSFMAQLMTTMFPPPITSSSSLVIRITASGLAIGHSDLNADPLVTTIQSLGLLYDNGCPINMSSQYPAVQLPLPSWTPSISSLIQWDHHVTYRLDSRLIDLDKNNTAVISKVIPFTFDKQNPEDAFLFDHRIDGRILYPATGYLAMAWWTLSRMVQRPLYETPIRFSDVLIERATVLNPNKSVSFSVRLNDELGSFIVKDGDVIVVSGKMELIDDFTHEVIKDHTLPICHELTLNDVYKEFRVRGYDYDPYFQGLMSARSDGREGKVIFRDVATESSLKALNAQSEDEMSMLWLRSWISFADSLIQLTLLNDDSTGRALLVPTKLESLICSPSSLRSAIRTSEEINDSLTLSPAKLIQCRYCKYQDVIEGPGLIMKGLKVSLLKRTQQMVRSKIYQFIPLNEDRVDQPYDPDMTDYTISEYCSVLRRIHGLTSSPNMSLVQDSDERHALLHSLLMHKNHLPIDPNRFYGGDLILGLHPDHFHDRLLKPSFDLITYNTIYSSAHNKLDIVEVAPTSASFSLEQSLHNLMDESLFSDQTSLGYSSCSSDDLKFPPNPQVILWRDTEVIPSDEVLNTIYGSLIDGGFLMVFSRTGPLNSDLTSILTHLHPERTWFPIGGEQLFGSQIESCGFTLISRKYLHKGLSPITSWLFKKATPLFPHDQMVIPVSLNNYDCWFEQLKEVMLSHQDNPLGAGKRIWLVNKPEEEGGISGILGFAKSLRLEPGGDVLRVVIHETEKVDFSDPKFAHLLQSDIVYNIYHDGAWGSYEHLFLPAPQVDSKVLPNVYLKCLKPGDLSSLTWAESNLKHQGVHHHPSTQIDVHYAALNFKDIMYASGRLAIDSVHGIDPLVAQDSLLGMEFAGVDTRTKQRMMGVLPYKALATTITIDENSFMLPVPESWTLEEAATVPVVYSTAFYGLIVRGHLRDGESVLIHSGAGGVGMAALNIVTSKQCEVFTTVGSPEKIDFLLNKFPSLKRSNILNSRDVTFEEDIFRLTDGRGVDVVLNSLSGDKLQASLRCVADNGRFIEIGKVDLLQDHQLFCWQLEGNRSMHGVYPESFFRFSYKKDHYFPPRMQEERRLLRDLIINGMRDGVVRPLNRTVFDKTHIEDAFRFMSSGKHMGKVVMRMRTGDDAPQVVQSVQQVTHFYPHKSYLVIGGLGGFGLEVVQWMAERGAKKIVVNSRRGLTSSYHQYCVNRLKSDGVTIIVSQLDSTTESGMNGLIKETQSLGPIGGLFNTAAVFEDMLFADQTVHTFDNVCAPKVRATQWMDRVSRQMNLKLDHFVAFSSISAGRGNPGQTSYNFANSIIDSICEQRHRDNLVSLSIQWGVIGDVGYVAEKSNSNNTVILGLSAQRMHSCLTHFDNFLARARDYPIAMCYVKADKSGDDPLAGSTDILKVVSRILGLKDIQSLDPSITLGNLGIDSLIAVEIQQILERILGTQVPLKQVKELTIGEFIAMTTKPSEEVAGG